MKIDLTTLILATAALLTPAMAQLPAATASRMEIVPRAGGGATSDCGVRSSMKIDPVTGHPGVAHFDRTTQQLIYTHWDGTSWEDLVVASLAAAPTDPDDYYCSLTYDATGIPNIAFYDWVQTNLYFARLNTTGTGFTITPVDYGSSIGTAGRFCALAYATDGKFYLSYYHHVFTSELRVATRSTTGVWSIATVDGPAGVDVGQWTSITVAHTGFPAVSYIDVTNQKVKAAYFNGTAWSKQTFYTASAYTTIGTHRIDDDSMELTIAFSEPAGYTLVVASAYAETSGANDGTIGSPLGYHSISGSTFSSQPSLVIDPQGHPLVTFYNGVSGGLHIAHGFPNARVATIDPIFATGRWNSLALAPDGLASVCYRDSTVGKLKYATLTGWVDMTIDSTDHVGSFASLGYSPDGSPAISYYDETHSKLKFTERGANGSWVTQTIDRSNFSGEYTSLNYGPTGRPAISYTAGANHNLKLAERDAAGNWSIQTISSAGNSVYYTSLRHSPEGNPVISYYYASDSTHRFIERGANGIWVAQTIDSASQSGLATSLSYGPEGRPSTSYYDLANNNLKFAERGANGSWVTQTIDSAGNSSVGISTSLSYGVEGRPAISYQDGTYRDLKFAERGANGSWIVRTIDSTGKIGEYTSLKHNPEGRPAISYYDSTNHDLKYAERDANGSWVAQTIDRTGDIGAYTSLSFDHEGRPAISYQDVGNYDLKYAERIISQAPGVSLPFQVLSLTRDPLTKAATLGWQGTAGAKYRVDFSPDLTAGSWQAIGDDINALDGMTFFRTSSLLGQSNPRAFFRVLRK